MGSQIIVTWFERTPIGKCIEEIIVSTIKKINWELEAEDFEFFCPVTGEQIVFAEAPFEASPAIVFCYLPSEREFEYVSEWADEKYDECLNKLPYDQYDRENEAFEMLIGSQTAIEENLICFTITINGMACGPISFTVHICIDMNYDITK